MSAKYAGLDAELAGMRQRKQELNLELKRLTDSIANGQQSQGIMNAIGDREKELNAITDKLLEPAPGSLRAKVEELREFAVSRLTKIRELLAHPENVQKAHEALAERVGQLMLVVGAHFEQFKTFRLLSGAGQIGGAREDNAYFLEDTGS